MLNFKLVSAIAVVDYLIIIPTTSQKHSGLPASEFFLGGGVWAALIACGSSKARDQTHATAVTTPNL